MTTAAATPPPGTNAPPPPAAAGGAPPPAAGGAAPPPAAGTKPATFLEGAGGEGTKAAEGTKAEPPAAGTKLELKFPETLKLDDARVKAFTELAGKQGLDSSKAQGIVDFYAETLAAQEKAGLEAAHAELKGWNEAIVADKELGGANIEATKQHASAALKAYATPELRELLQATGLGSHPEVVRFVTKVGKALADDTVAGGTGGSAPDTKSQDAFLANLFPSMHPRK